MDGREQQEGESSELAQLQSSLASVYKVERLLMRRGTTVVYRAAEIKPPRPVALRMFPPDLDLARVAPRFRELAPQVMALNHPNIVPVHRVVFRGGVPYFVAMKLVEGRYLDEIIQSQGALSVPAILAVVRSAAAALAYAHGRGVVHGALSAASILVDREGQVWLWEFGIARAVEDAARSAAGSTRAARREESASALGDQHAFGIVALTMLTGASQFGADPLASLREARSVRHALPDALVQIVQTALAQDPTQRFASTADLVAAIEAIAFGDADGREAAVVLGRLARGEPVPKLRALARPPGADMRMPGPPKAPPAAEPATPPPAPVPVEAEQEPAEEPAVEPAPSAPEAKTASAPPAPPFARAVPPPRISRTSQARRVVPAPAPRKGRSRLVWALAGVLVVAGLAGGAYWLLGRRPAAAPTAQAPAAAPAAPGGAPPAAAPDSARANSGLPGLLLFSVNPSAADIFVDGVPIDSEGFVDLEVKAGRHRLEINAPGFEAYDTVVMARAGATLDLGRISLFGAGMGRLRLRAAPPNAQIFVDGRQVGVGSLDDFEVAAGRRQIRISAPGYFAFDTIISLGAGATALLGQISLESTQGGP